MSSVIESLLSRRVLWVTGKGGTGKSTVAAALALIGAETGKRTLLIDVEGRGDAAGFLDAAAPRYDAKQAHTNLWHLAMEPEAILDEYLRVALHVPRIYRMGPITKVFDFIATAAPGVREILVAGKVGFEERAVDNGSNRWDLVVVDAAPSGQVLSHLRGPRSIQELVDVGMIRNQTDWVRKIVEDPARTGVVVVSLPEEMPASETEEFVSTIADHVATPVLAVVINRLAVASDRLRSLVTAGGPGLEAASVYARMADNQLPYAERLGELGPPALTVPLLGFTEHDLAITSAVASALRSEP